MRTLFLNLFLLTLLLNPLFIDDVLAEENLSNLILENCTNLSSEYTNSFDPDETIDSSLFKKYQCDISYIYYAFEDNNNFETIKNGLKTNESATRELLDLFNNKKMLEVVRNNTNLQDKIIEIFNDENLRKEFFYFLKNLDEKNISILEHIGDDAYTDYIKLKLLVPSLPNIDVLKRKIKKNEAELIIKILNQTSLNSDDEYAPSLTEEPYRTIEIYQKFIKVWTINKTSYILKETPNVVSSLLPPMQWKEISLEIGEDKYNPDLFKKMQDDYIRVQNIIFNFAKNEYGTAWACNVCESLADLLAYNLYGANQKQISSIERFIKWLISSNNNIFKGLVLPTACEETNNFEKFSIFLTENPKTILALADWHSENNILDNLLMQWAKNTSFIKFSHVFDTATSNGEVKNDQLSNEDIKFLSSLMVIANFRYKLAYNDRKNFDHVLSMIRSWHTGNKDYILATAFMAEIEEPFFKVTSGRYFRNFDNVTYHLLNFGYPDSSEDSLFTYFLKNQPVNYAKAIKERGHLPEEKLLKHGYTISDSFKEKIGLSPDDAISIVDSAATAIWITGSLIVVVGTAGTATPAVAAGTVGMQSIKQALKVSAKKAIGKTLEAFGTKNLQKIVVKNLSKNIYKKSNRLAFRKVLKTGQWVKKFDSNLVSGSVYAANVINKGENINKLFEKLKDRKNINAAFPLLLCVFNFQCIEDDVDKDYLYQNRSYENENLCKRPK